MYFIYIIIETIKAPASPAVLVFIMVKATASALSFEEIEPTEPPLKPNHPIHKRKAPSVTKGILDAGITLIPPFLGYLPRLLPIINMAANNAHPPVL